MNQIWQVLEQHRAATAERPIMDLFEADPARFATFSAAFGDMLLDFSKTGIDAHALELLLRLAEAADLAARREAMFSGERINESEGRAVLHTALRNLSGAPVMVDGEDVMPGVRQTLDRMSAFCEAVRSGEITASDGGPFTDVINIGIGGSDLGPAMATGALAPYHDGPRVHFVSNVDGAHLADTIRDLEPRRTLVIVASKSFTTIETMTNANSARAWLRRAVGEAAAGAHLAAISSAIDKAEGFGIHGERVFAFEDWVGGRYSMWGPIGLPIMLAIGSARFGEFLDGAHEMDSHFRAAPLAENLPVLLGLIGVWHRNVCGYPSRAILPYDQRLTRLPAYLQQADMESNGKAVARDGTPLVRASGPIVWGEPGTNGQHAFHQLLHQGTDVIPCEFMVAAEGHEPELAEHHLLLLANCLAQSEALMRGRDPAETADPHRQFPGNRPSITVLYRRLDPATLGRLVALYEHRIFVEGVIWNLNSFDQWGVELGKELTGVLAPLIKRGQGGADKDGSTNGLIAAIDRLKETNEGPL